eukprot:2159805-Rhodomonas_salina.3
MTLENVRLHSDALAECNVLCILASADVSFYACAKLCPVLTKGMLLLGITITLELDEKHVRTLNGYLILPPPEIQLNRPQSQHSSHQAFDVPMPLRARYAVSGTDLGHAATRRENRRLYQKQLGHDTCSATLFRFVPMRAYCAYASLIPTQVLTSLVRAEHYAQAYAIHGTDAESRAHASRCHVIAYRALKLHSGRIQVGREQVTWAQTHVLITWDQPVPRADNVPLGPEPGTTAMISTSNEYCIALPACNAKAGTRVRANSGAVHVTEAGASLVDFDCQLGVAARLRGSTAIRGPIVNAFDPALSRPCPTFPRQIYGLCPDWCIAFDPALCRSCQINCLCPDLLNAFDPALGRFCRKRSRPRSPRPWSSPRRSPARYNSTPKPDKSAAKSCKSTLKSCKSAATSCESTPKSSKIEDSAMCSR